VTAISWIARLEPLPENAVAVPTLGPTFCKLDFGGYFDNAGHTVPVTLVFLFVSIFDTAGVQFAAGTQAKLIKDDGKLPASKVAFFASAMASFLGSLLGTSPIIIHNETCAGIQDGGRTGLTAVTVGVWFLVSLPFIPIFKAIPAIATAPPLILVGMFMMVHAKFIDWESIDEAMPAFMTITLIPLTYSIAVGMVFGLSSYFIIQVLTLLGHICLGRAQPPKEEVTVIPQSPYVNKTVRIPMNQRLSTLQLLGSASRGPRSGQYGALHRYNTVPNLDL